jgi:hypothetical protein
MALVGAAGDRRGLAAKLFVGQSTSEVDLFVPKGTPTRRALVGAALAAKLLIAPITLVDKCTLFVKSTSVVDFFVPKGTPTRGRGWLQQTFQCGDFGFFI